MAFIRFSYSERIGLHHIALYRSWINGLDPQEMGERYIGETDPRIVNRVIEGLRERFVQAAKRANLHRHARLLMTKLRRDEDASPPPQTQIRPSLEQFQEEYDPSECLSEAELIELYSQHYPETTDSPQSGSSRRRERWIEQQNTALFWIQELLGSAPLPNDAIQAWFEGSAIEHLQKAKIATLHDLKAYIEDKGKRWYHHVSGIGEAVAERIVNWIDENPATLGKLDPRARLSRLDIARSTGPSPAGTSHVFQVLSQANPAPSTPGRMLTSAAIEVLPALSSEAQLLDAVSHRRKPSQPPLHESLIGANTDQEAMNAWLDAKAGGSAHTHRVYEREVLRFLYFLMCEKSIGVREALVEDVADYRNFLALIGRDGVHWPFKRPSGAFVAPKGTPRMDPRWKPFSGALKPESAQYALGVVKSFLDYLVQVRYLSANPMVTISVKVAAKDQRSTPKGLSVGQFKLVLDYVKNLEASHQNARLRFLTVFAYQSALRVSELATATTSMLTLVEKGSEAGHHLLLGVHGKGNKIRNVYLGDEVKEAWSEYALWRKTDPSLSASRHVDMPILASLDGSTIGEDRIFDLVKEIFAGAAALARENGLEDDARIIEVCSPHDFRHSRGRHLGQSALPLPMLQRLLGHSSIATTGIYTTNGDLEMAEALAAVGQSA